MGVVAVVVSRACLRLALPTMGLFALSACAGRIDRFTVDRVVGRALQVPDTAKVCGLGEALVHPLGSVSKRPPNQALLVAEAVAALCDQSDAWTAELAAARARKNGLALGEARAAEMTDAAVAAARAHARAAERFELSFAHLEAAFGPVGDGPCPKIAARDEFVYVLGLVAGTLGLLHDRASGGVNDVQLDRLAHIARGAACVEDARWWSVPSALKGAAYATVPGSGPDGIDPWALLSEAADKGDATGVRVARAIQVLIAANAGRDDVLEAALAAHAAAMSRTADPNWRLLDAYATEVSLQQSDLVWTRERGHRTEVFGSWPAPVPDVVAPVGTDLFGDPFGTDPFGTDPFATPKEPPQEETP